MPQDLDPAELEFLNSELNKRGYQLHGDAVFETAERKYLDEDESEELLGSLLLLLA